jgi:multicomponent Na+:H+ antiporter subunit E
MKALRWLIRLVPFMGFYLREVLLSNLRVAYDVLTPRLQMRPAIVTVDIEGLSDQQLIALTNLITMTPGTLSLDVSDDHRVLFVHAMYVDDLEQFHRDLQDDFVRRVRRVF